MESDRAVTTYASLFVLVMTSACELPPQYCEGEPALPDQAPPAPSARVVAQVLPAESTAVDILFVIDDSMSMMDEQEQLATWSSEMFDVLSDAGELPDLHIAVTPTSVAISTLTHCQTGGTLHVGTAVLDGARFIRDVAGPTGRIRNYSGTLKETFGKMARVGDSGCGFEQPFKAARLALTGLAGGAEEFLRDDALLLVVFVTDEDDCSAKSPALFYDQQGDACSELGVITSYRCFEHGVECYDGKGARAFGERRNCRPDESSPYVESVAGFAQYLKQLKSNPAQVVVAGIYGKPNGITAIRDDRITTYETPRLADICGAGGKEGNGATPAVRMNALMAEFGGRASHSSICDNQLSWAMRDVGLVTRGAATRSRCLRGELADLDALAPGIQPACRVEASDDAGIRALPPCDRTDGRDCFTVAPEAACADTESKLAVRISGDDNVTVTVSCDVPLPGSFAP
jgi:hypothetical protein